MIAMDACCPVCYEKDLRVKATRKRPEGHGEPLCADCWENWKYGVRYITVNGKQVVDRGEDGPIVTDKPRAGRPPEKLRRNEPLISLDELLDHAATESGISRTMLVSTRRTAVLVNARRAFSMQARDLGYTLTEIGDMLNLHHTTVGYLLGRKSRWVAA